MGFATRLLLLLATATIAAAASASARPEPLASLLARMRERNGALWDAHVSADLRTVGGKGRPVEVRYDAQGLRTVTDRCAQGLCEGAYFDGERRWSIDLNGTALPELDGADAYERAERTIESLAFLAPNFTQNGGSIFDDGYTSISGKRYRTLLVANGDATPMDAFIDPATATVTYARDINGDDTFQYSGYARAGSLLLPSDVLRNGRPFEHFTNRHVDAAPLAVPHGPLATFTSGPATLADDPNSVIPIVACTIQGVPARCLLDSGNSGLSIGISLSEKLGLTSVGSFQVRGLGDYATEVVRAGPLSLGTMTFSRADYVVLHDIERYGYDVVLGADLFAATTVEIDARSHRVVLGATAPPGGVSVPIAFEDFVPMVDVRLGSVPAELAIDTGDESGINLAYAFYRTHRGLFSATTEREVTGVGGTSIEFIGTIPHVTIGNLSIPWAAIGATRMLEGTGHVGAAVLSRYDLLIDYAGSSVHFMSP